MSHPVSPSSSFLSALYFSSVIFPLKETPPFKINENKASGKMKSMAASAVPSSGFSKHYVTSSQYLEQTVFWFRFFI